MEFRESSGEPLSELPGRSQFLLPEHFFLDLVQRPPAYLLGDRLLRFRIPVFTRTTSDGPSLLAASSLLNLSGEFDRPVDRDLPGDLVGLPRRLTA